MPITQVKNPVIANNTIAPAKLNVTSSMQTFLSSATSANLAATIADETGSGSLVFATSPTLVSPSIGAATGTTLSLGLSLPAMTVIRAYSAGSSGNNVWRGRIVAGGDTCCFLMGEINGQAWLGAHNAALNQWEDFYINPDGGKKVGIGDAGGGAGNIAVPLLTVDNASSSVGIGTGNSAINGRAILELSSTSRGFLPPRMTTAQRNAITSAPAGLMIYNTDTNRYNEFSGSAWQEILDSSNLGTNVSAFLATPTSANLLAAITDETGSGSLVFNTNPTLSGANIAGNLTVDTNTLFVDSVNNRIGIGTSTPLAKLDVNGSVNIGSNLAPFTGTYSLVVNDVYGSLILNRLGESEPFIRLTSNGLGGFQFRGLTTGGVRFTGINGGDEWVRVTNTGNVGIGTTSPNERLTVSGNISATGIVTAEGNKLAAETFAIAMAIAVG